MRNDETSFCCLFISTQWCWRCGKVSNLDTIVGSKAEPDPTRTIPINDNWHFYIDCHLRSIVPFLLHPHRHHVMHIISVHFSSVGGREKPRASVWVRYRSGITNIHLFRLVNTGNVIYDDGLQSITDLSNWKKSAELLPSCPEPQQFAFFCSHSTSTKSVNKTNPISTPMDANLSYEIAHLASI